MYRMPIRLGLEPFSKKILREHKDIWVLLSCTVLVGFISTGSLIWASMKKDYNLIRSNPRLDESFDLLHPVPLKLLIINPRNLAPRPRLHETYRLMGIEERKRRREDEANCQGQRFS